MSNMTSYEAGLAVLRRAWTYQGPNNHGAVFALKFRDYRQQAFAEILAAMRVMPREADGPSLEVIQLVWRIPAQMLYYRVDFADRPEIRVYDTMCFDILVEATHIIGVRLNEADAQML